jgi:hypothetical protein
MVSPELADIIRTGSAEEYALSFPTCTYCGARDDSALFDDRGQRLCRDCYRRLSAKTRFYVPHGERCHICGCVENEIYIDPAGPICAFCFLGLRQKPSIRQMLIVPSSTSHLPDFTARPRPSYSVGYSPKYRPRYNPGPR